MALTKEGLKKEFSRDWQDKYQVEIFRREGFVRKRCRCGNNFWTLDPERTTCGAPPCDAYGFIGKPITKEKWNYIETWKQFEKFFVRNGHASVPRYPVVDRWRPDLYFTIASIQDFQRIDRGNIVMEYPSDPLIVPQVCLRFPDIPNVGVTGRHHTSFIMPGQHSFGKYWKDRTIELNFDFLTKVMGIPKREITYIEDMWSMPDFSQFGPSLETFSLGLELVNSVFSAYTAAGNGYKELPQKVIDVGWGHERLVWFSNGTPSGYDSAFGPVTDWMKKQTGLHENELLKHYAVFAGSLTYDEVENLEKVRKDLAKRLGVSVKELHRVVEPMQALYAIADHTKSLLFAVADGGIPSNVGGGYNLRVILRRCLSFMQEFGFDFDLMKIAETHAAFLKPMFPELWDGLEPLARVLEVEKERYIRSMQKARGLVVRQLDKGIEIDDLIVMYTSHGINPELVERIAKQEKKPFTIPENFYGKLTEAHMVGTKETEKEEIKADVSRVPETELVFYKDPYATEFKAKVIYTLPDDWVVFDQTLFYPEGGGQPADQGTVKARGRELPVKDVQKIGGVVLHKVAGLHEGVMVEGRVDWNRRFRLMQMHTATHIVAGAARQVLGKHIWQAGAQKGLESSRIDLTHYQPFTPSDLEAIERTANRTVEKGLPVTSRTMPRSAAEKEYGFVLYQGGASPGKNVRVIHIQGVDAEACAGTHLTNTKETEIIKIIKSERIQDGVNRLVFTVADAARKFSGAQEETFRKAAIMLGSLPFPEKVRASLKADTYTKAKLRTAAGTFSVEPPALIKTIEKFSKEVEQNLQAINTIRKRLKQKPLSLKQSMDGLIPKDVPDACEILFAFWKSQQKEQDRLAAQFADSRAQGLLKKAKGNKIMDIVEGSRKELIETASTLIKKNDRLTVILANRSGEIIGMSRTQDMSKLIKDLCKKAGGSGGGSPKLAQGKADPKKLKIMRMT